MDFSVLLLSSVVTIPFKKAPIVMISAFFVLAKVIPITLAYSTTCCSYTVALLSACAACLFKPFFGSAVL